MPFKQTPLANFALDKRISNRVKALGFALTVLALAFLLFTKYADENTGFTLQTALFAVGLAAFFIVLTLIIEVLSILLKKSTGVVLLALMLAFIPTAVVWYDKASVGEAFSPNDIPPFSWIPALIALFMLLENSGIADKIGKRVTR